MSEEQECNDTAQAHLLEAAQAARQWARARRAAWTDRPLPAPSAPPAPPRPPAAWPLLTVEADAEPIEEPIDAAPAPQPIRAMRPSFADSAAADPSADDAIIEPQVMSGDTKVPWAGYAMAAALVAGVVAGAGFYGPRYFAARKETPAKPPVAATSATPPAAAAPSPPARVGQIEVHSDPDGAVVVVDGTERGSTPLTLRDLAVGPHTVVVRSEKGSVERHIDVAEGATAKVEESIYPGWLHVTSSIDLTISEGAQGIRLNDDNAVLLPAGTHTLRFENRDANFSVTREVVIKPGETMAISIVPGQAVKVGATR